MAERLSSPHLVRFGAFEIDLRSGELRKSGLKIKLQEQPLQVLAMLLRHPGEIVTREELQKAVWPADTFVDFDRGLNKAINKIREALGDEADNPRFVETLPRRGYRFIAPVNSAGVVGDLSPGAANAGPPSPTGRGAGGEGVAVAERGLAVGAVREPVPRRQWGWPVAVGGAALLVAPVLAFLFGPTPSPRVTASTQVTSDGRDKERMVSDGSRIYFSSLSGDRFALYQASAAGGDTVPLQTSIPNPISVDISPDRSELLLRGCVGNQQNCPLWVLPVLGRSRRRVGNIRASDAAWSQDGKEIAYAQGNSLYRVKIDGTESRKIVSVARGWKSFLAPLVHPTEAICVSACRLKTTPTAYHFGKSPPTEKISTSCSPDGTTRQRSVAIVGRATANTSFFSPGAVEPGQRTQVNGLETLE